TPQFAILRIVVDKPEEAKRLLIDSGFAVTVSEAIAVELEDKPGVLHDLLQVIADAGFGVNYIYSIVFRNGKIPLIILNTDNLDESKEILIQKGYSVAQQEDVL
ncbi:MAG: amino acid-binding protein, partial [Herbinix sp.]|nr:amino acid-binding protein [Herbinix sp.]